MGALCRFVFAARDASVDPVEAEGACDVEAGHDSRALVGERATASGPRRHRGGARSMKRLL